MRRVDIGSAMALAALAAVYLVANRQYPLDSLAAPGPGVFPLVVGAFALVVAGWQLALGLRQSSRAPGPISAETVTDQPADESPTHDVPQRRGHRHPVAMLALLISYPAAIALLGGLAASFILVLAACRLLGARGWLGPLALALGVTAGVYVIFVVWLGVPLPAGIVR